ncbi:hypothetical protein [Desulfobacter latus]|uniref:Uncharacterized protein n=1 Tax=Desulfobacter latus TaxID=2292 RepID=A0A850T2U6_9BACT|nr:hypothetical protein [Desulfobacter latus]NWH06053.1 hypothetical protein [Desulfobacter latus]
MEAIREIVDLEKLSRIINIPENFKYTKVEIFVFPIEDKKQDIKKKFDPESFYGISHINDPEKDIRQMRGQLPKPKRLRLVKAPR